MAASAPETPAHGLLAESGLGSSRDPIDAAAVRSVLQSRYQLSGDLRPLATEKDDTFRLRTASGHHLVKVSSPDESQAVVGLQTAAMRFLEGAAPELPVQRVRLTVDGRDNVVWKPATGARECCGFSGSSTARSGLTRFQMVRSSRR